MGKASLFFGGIPTKPDVEKLIQEFGTLKPGDIIAYDRISEIIGQKRDTNRWHSVVYAWRKRLSREFNIELSAVMNKGYEVLTNSGRISRSVSEFVSNVKGIRDAANLAQRTPTDGLSLDEIRNKNHVENVGAAIILKASTEARRLKYPDPK